jgi:hypothetical protein
MALHLRDGLVCPGRPDHDQFIIDQAHFHQDRPRRNLTVKPIEAGCRGCHVYVWFKRHDEAYRALSNDGNASTFKASGIAAYRSMRANSSLMNR